MKGLFAAKESLVCERTSDKTHEDTKTGGTGAGKSEKRRYSK